MTTLWLIGGAQRSGTTLLQTLVCNHLSAAPLLSEAHILFRLLETYGLAKKDGEKTADFYADVEGLRRFYRQIVDLHLADLATRHAALDQFVLKDPNFARLLPDLKELLPSARLLVTMRDPRDIAASFVQIGLRERALGREVKNYTDRNIDFFCKKIKQAYQPLIDDPALTDQVLLIRYEALARTPDEVMAMVLAGVNGAAPAMARDLNTMRWLDPEKRHKASWISPLEEGPPSAANIGAYRTTLTTEETAKVQDRCAEIMAAFGYDNDAIETD